MRSGELHMSCTSVWVDRASLCYSRSLNKKYWQGLWYRYIKTRKLRWAKINLLHLIRAVLKQTHPPTKRPYSPAFNNTPPQNSPNLVSYFLSFVGLKRSTSDSWVKNLITWRITNQNRAGHELFTLECYVFQAYFSFIKSITGIISYNHKRRQEECDCVLH